MIGVLDICSVARCPRFTPPGAGVAHEYGSGVSKDFREAARWYFLAAAQGLAESNYHLGLMKAHGRGFAQDLSGAAIHFQKVRPPAPSFRRELLVGPQNIKGLFCVENVPGKHPENLIS